MLEWMEHVDLNVPSIAIGWKDLSHDLECVGSTMVCFNYLCAHMDRSNFSSMLKRSFGPRIRSRWHGRSPSMIATPPLVPPLPPEPSS